MFSFFSVVLFITVRYVGVKVNFVRAGGVGSSLLRASGGQETVP